MKKLLTAFFLGLFVFAGAPVVLHADDAAAEPAVDSAAKEAPQAKHMKKRHKKTKKTKKHKKAKKAAEASDASAAPAEGAAK